jgi:hypothetical protein
MPKQHHWQSRQKPHQVPTTPGPLGPSPEDPQAFTAPACEHPSAQRPPGVPFTAANVAAQLLADRPYPSQHSAQHDTYPDTYQHQETEPSHRSTRAHAHARCHPYGRPTPRGSGSTVLGSDDRHCSPLPQRITHSSGIPCSDFSPSQLLSDPSEPPHPATNRTGSNPAGVLYPSGSEAMLGSEAQHCLRHHSSSEPTPQSVSQALAGVYDTHCEVIQRPKVGSYYSGVQPSQMELFS